MSRSMRLAIAGISGLLLSGWAAAQTLQPGRTASPPSAGAAAQPGMRIGGDRDGPVGLFVAPWQEPVEVLPEVHLQAALPRVVDGEHNLLEDPFNRQLPAPGAAAARQAESKATTPATARRGRGKKDEEVPKAIIMQHEKQ